MKFHSLRTSLSLSRASLIEKQKQKKIVILMNKNTLFNIYKLQIFQHTLPVDVTYLFPMKLISTDLRMVLIL